MKNGRIIVLLAIALLGTAMWLATPRPRTEPSPWVNFDWPNCMPTNGATSWAPSTATLKVWDKNNPDATNWCIGGQDWRVDSRQLHTVSTDSFVIEYDVDLSKCTGTQGLVNCNIYLTAPTPQSDGSWSYCDAFKDPLCPEMDLMETGSRQVQSSPPKYMQVTSHAKNDKAGTYTIVNFEGSDYRKEGAQQNLQTSFDPLQSMTFSWTLSQADNIKVTITQGANQQQLDIGFEMKEYARFAEAYASSVGINNDFAPTMNTEGWGSFTVSDWKAPESTPIPNELMNYEEIYQKTA